MSSKHTFVTSITRLIGYQEGMSEGQIIATDNFAGSDFDYIMKITGVIRSNQDETSEHEELLDNGNFNESEAGSIYLIRAMYERFAALIRIGKAFYLRTDIPLIEFDYVVNPKTEHDFAMYTTDEELERVTVFGEIIQKQFDGSSSAAVSLTLTGTMVNTYRIEHHLELLPHTWDAITELSGGIDMNGGGALPYRESTINTSSRWNDGSQKKTKKKSTSRKSSSNSTSNSVITVSDSSDFEKHKTGTFRVNVVSAKINAKTYRFYIYDKNKNLDTENSIWITKENVSNIADVDGAIAEAGIEMNNEINHIEDGGLVIEIERHTSYKTGNAYWRNLKIVR